MEIISRKDALSQGLKHYFTGKPCKRGHISKRYVSGISCVECTNNRALERHHKNRPRSLRQKKRWWQANRSHNLEYKRRWKKENKEVYLEGQRRWQRNNPGKIAAKAAKRRAAKLLAIPLWADLDAIKDFYLNCPDGYHVDHIVPLQHPLVCGLHSLENLQYLTAEENLKKGNSISFEWEQCAPRGEE